MFNLFIGTNECILLLLSFLNMDTCVEFPASRNTKPCWYVSLALAHVCIQCFN